MRVMVFKLGRATVASAAPRCLRSVAGRARAAISGARSCWPTALSGNLDAAGGTSPPAVCVAGWRQAATRRRARRASRRCVCAFAWPGIDPQTMLRAVWTAALRSGAASQMRKGLSHAGLAPSHGDREGGLPKHIVDRRRHNCAQAGASSTVRNQSPAASFSRLATPQEPTTPTIHVAHRPRLALLASVPSGNDHRTRGCARVVPVRSCARRAGTIKGRAPARAGRPARGVEWRLRGTRWTLIALIRASRLGSAGRSPASTRRCARPWPLGFCRIHTELRPTRERMRRLFRP